MALCDADYALAEEYVAYLDEQNDAAYGSYLAELDDIEAERSGVRACDICGFAETACECKANAEDDEYHARYEEDDLCRAA